MAPFPIHIRVLNIILSKIQFNNKPLMVIGHGRSGTTWIGDTLSKAQNTLLYHEPCNPYLPKGSPMSELWFKYLEEKDESDFFENRLGAAYNGLVDMNSSIWFRDKKKLLVRLNPNHKIIIKEVASVMNIDWLQKKYPSDMLFVLRHPCSVALSEFERDIDGKKSLEFLLENKKLLNLFTDYEKSFFTKASKPFEYYGLIWAIRNKPFSSKISEGEKIFNVRYELLAEKPVDEFKRIFENFKLKWTKDIENYIIQNTSKESKGHYKTTKNAQNHIDRWKTKLTEEQISQVKEFTLPFKLGFYDESFFNV